MHHSQQKGGLAAAFLIFADFSGRPRPEGSPLGG
jgi:hypothetical protein